MRRLSAWRWSLDSSPRSVLLVALAVLAYFLVFIPGYRSFGLTIFALSLIPVGLAGYLLGSLPSVVVGLVLVLGSQPLLPLVGMSGWQLITDQWAGLVIMFAVGLGLGWLSALLQQLRRERATLQAEIAERQRAEAEFSDLNAQLEQRVASRSAALLQANAQLQSEIAERQRAELEITHQAQALARSRDFLAALGQVAAHIASELELDQIIGTLSAQLRRLDLFFFLTQSEPERPAVLRYVSVDAPVLALAEQQFGFSLRGWSFPSQPLIDRELLEGQRPVFFRSMPTLIGPLPNALLRRLIGQAFRLAGITADTAACLLPLVVQGRVWGIIGIWGATLQEADQPALAVLAHQLAVAIENADLFAAEHERSAELALAGEQLRQELVERQRAEAALQASERRFRALIEHSSDVVVLVDGTGGILYHSPAVRRVLGYPPEELFGRNAFEFMHPDDVLEQQAQLARLLTGASPLSGQYRLRHRAGGWHWVDATATNLLADPDVRALVINYRDVTERRLSEQALKASEERFRQIAENVQEVFYVLDHREPQLLYVSPAFETVWGRPAASLYQQPGLFRDAIQPADRPRIDAAVERQRRGEYTDEEYTIQRPDGTQRHIRDRAFPVQGEQGARVIGIAEDVTERRQADDQLRASLRDKEVLLKEIHHRVKNNLQVISSLLSLQSRQVTDPRALEMLRDSQSRVRSMALVHEKLYRSADLAHFDFAEYVRGLAAQLLRTYGDQSAAIVLTVQADPCQLDVELAVACGLILNELISNALKHAFPGGRSGEIHISLERAAAGRVVLRVSDDGLGWPAGLDFRHTPSLGLQLVNNLIDQIGGSLALETGPGTTFRIEFSTIPLNTKSDHL